MIYTRSIKKNTDFKKMYYTSKYKIGMFTVIYLRRSKEKDAANLGITVSKKVGNAVLRNRVKRIILAAYNELEKSSNFKGYNIVIVARKNSNKVKMWDIFKEIKKNIFILKKETINGKFRVKRSVKYI